MLQERQVALIRELLSDKDTMSRLNDNERQTLMQLSQCHHDDMTSPRKRYESLKSYRILHGRTEIRNFFSSVEKYFTSERSKRVKYCFNRRREISYLQAAM